MTKRIIKKLIPDSLRYFNKANIAMFHIGRSGSTVLGDLLQQHPDIFWDGELFDSRGSKFTNSIARKLNLFPFVPFNFIRVNMLKARGKYYGFETKFFHLSKNGISLSEYFDKLQNMGFDHFIVLKRRNYLRKVISSLIGKQKNRYHQSLLEKPELNRIKVDVDAI